VKNTLLLAAALVLATSCCHRGAETPRSSFPTHAYQATVSITNAKGKIGGAAVVLRCRTGHPLVIITAAHVASIPFPLFVTADARRLQPVRAFKTDAANDLALMVGPQQRAACREATIGDPAKPGDDVWLIGALSRRHRNVSRGVISYLQAGKAQRYTTDAAAYYGSSGGGMFDQQGRLIGIASSVTFTKFGRISVAALPGSTHAIHTKHLLNLVRGVL